MPVCWKTPPAKMNPRRRTALAIQLGYPTGEHGPVEKRAGGHIEFQIVEGNVRQLPGIALRPFRLTIGRQGIGSLDAWFCCACSRWGAGGVVGDRLIGHLTRPVRSLCSRCRCDAGSVSDIPGRMTCWGGSGQITSNKQRDQSQARDEQAGLTRLSEPAGIASSLGTVMLPQISRREQPADDSRRCRELHGHSQRLSHRLCRRFTSLRKYISVWSVKPALASPIAES